MEDKHFKDVTIMTSQVGRMLVINSTLRAAEYLLTEWPIFKGPKLSVAKHALLKCLEGEMSPGVARMAFIEAAKEAEIYIETAGRPVSAGKLEKWRKGKMPRSA